MTAPDEASALKPASRTAEPSHVQRRDADLSAEGREPWALTELESRASSQRRFHNTRAAFFCLVGAVVFLVGLAQVWKGLEVASFRQVFGSAGVAALLLWLIFGAIYPPGRSK